MSQDTVSTLGHCAKMRSCFYELLSCLSALLRPDTPYCPIQICILHIQVHVPPTVRPTTPLLRTLLQRLKPRPFSTSGWCIFAQAWCGQHPFHTHFVADKSGGTGSPQTRQTASRTCNTVETAQLLLVTGSVTGVRSILLTVTLQYTATRFALFWAFTVLSFLIMLAPPFFFFSLCKLIHKLYLFLHSL